MAGSVGQPDRSAQPVHRPPDWVRYAIWWQVFPLGMVGAEDESDAVPSVQHRLGRITGWLDHLITLGCNGLLLGPLFSAMSHGYDTLDYYAIDPRLGDDGDFDELVAAAHARGIRVVLDGVFNHVGSGHPLTVAAREHGQDSDAGRWFRWAEGELTYFEGHTQLVALDHDAPAVRDEIVAVMKHWLGRGVDGWRLDAAYSVPTSFWAEVLPRVREEYPEAWFVAEVIQEDFTEFAAASTADSVTEYELWKATWSSLRDRNLYELDWTLKRHADMVESFLPLTFVGNHDVTRVASQIPDRRLWSHAAALLLFLPGVPSIYYGDEFGFEAVKEERLGGDDAIRPELPEQPGQLDGSDLLNTYKALISLRRQQPWLVDSVITTGELSNTTMVVTAVARTDDAQRLVLALNLGDQPVAAPPGEVLIGPVADGELAAAAWAVIRPGR